MLCYFYRIICRAPINQNDFIDNRGNRWKNITKVLGFITRRYNNTDTWILTLLKYAGPGSQVVVIFLFHENTSNRLSSTQWHKFIDDKIIPAYIQLIVLIRVRFVIADASRYVGTHKSSSHGKIAVFEDVLLHRLMVIGNQALTVMNT